MRESCVRFVSCSRQRDEREREEELECELTKPREREEGTREKTIAVSAKPSVSSAYRYAAPARPSFAATYFRVERIGIACEEAKERVERDVRRGKTNRRRSKAGGGVERRKIETKGEQGEKAGRLILDA